MSWEDMLKGKTSAKAVKLVDEIMSDKKPRTEREILDDLWTEVEKRKKEGLTRRKHSPPSGRLMIPTTRELRYYLGNDAKYESAIYDSITGKRRKSRSSRLSETKYWMK